MAWIIQSGRCWSSASAIRRRASGAYSAKFAVHALPPQQRRIAAVAERHAGRAPHANNANAQKDEHQGEESGIDRRHGHETKSSTFERCSLVSGSRLIVW